MVNHDIVWLYVSVHYSHTVAVVESLGIEERRWELDPTSIWAEHLGTAETF